MLRVFGSERNGGLDDLRTLTEKHGTHLIASNAPADFSYFYLARLH